MAELGFQLRLDLSEAASQLMAGMLADLAAHRVEVAFSGVAKGTSIETALAPWLDGRHGVRAVALLDEAIEWAEDRIIGQHGQPTDLRRA